MSPAGPCKECGSGLDAGQLYCIECGMRVGPPLALPYAATGAVAAATEGAAATAGTAQASGGLLAALPMPAQAAATCAALALGLGVVAGTALNPNLTGSLAGQTVVVEAPPAPEPEVPAAAPSAPAPAPAPAAVASAPVTTFSEDTGTPTTGGGGGGGKTPKAKPELASGTVIHQNTVASSYSVTSGTGITVIHTTKGLPAPGTNVSVPIRDLANLTVAEDGKRKATGQATGATFSGIVTSNVDSTDPAVRDVYTLSARAASILIHSPADASVGTVNKPPPVGTILRATVEISPTIVETPTPAPPPVQNQAPVPAAPAPSGPSCAAPATAFPNPPVFPPKSLYETAQAVEAPAADVTNSELSSVVQAVCAGTGQILLATDDVREGKADLFDAMTGTVLTAGPSVAFSSFVPGQAVMANVNFAEDSDPATPAGTKIASVVTGIRDDTGVTGADAATGQGDLAP